MKKHSVAYYYGNKVEQSCNKSSVVSDDLSLCYRL